MHEHYSTVHLNNYYPLYSFYNCTMDVHAQMLDRTLRNFNYLKFRMLFSPQNGTNIAKQEQPLKTNCFDDPAFGQEPLYHHKIENSTHIPSLSEVCAALRVWCVKQL